MGTKLQRLAGLESANMVDQMQQVYDRFIPTSSVKSVNISNRVQKTIMHNWTTIKSTQAVGYLLKARSEIAAMLVMDALSRDIQSAIISKKLCKTLQLVESPTDKEVMKRLDAMAPQQIVHQGGKKLSHEETLKQYAALYGQ